MAEEQPQHEHDPDASPPGTPGRESADSAPRSGGGEGKSDPAESAASAESMAEAAMDEVDEAAEVIAHEAGAGERLDLPQFNGKRSTDRSGGRHPLELSLLDDVSLKVKIELGRTLMYVEDVLRLNEDSVVELDKAAGDPVDVYVNDRLVARGEVLVVNDNFCVRVSEIIAPTKLSGEGG